MKSTIQLTDTIIRNQNLLASQIDNEVVMMDVDVGNYYGLNSVGSKIWDMLDAPQTVQHICEKLQNQYDVSQETCESEVLTFIEDMHNRNLIEYAENMP